MEKRKVYGTILALTIFVIMMLSVSYAYFYWSSSNTNKTNVNLTVTRAELTNFINYKQGISVLGTTNYSLQQSTSYTGGISATIEFWKNPAYAAPIYGQISLKMLTLLSASGTTDTNIGKTDTIKWAVTTYTATNSTEVLVQSGTFNGKTQGDKFAIYENFELNGEKTYYKIYIWFDSNAINSTYPVSGETISAEIRAAASDVMSQFGESLATLIKLGLDDEIQETAVNFSKTSCSSGCEEATVGIYAAEDDLGTSYYFRGDVTNNYVKFGKNSSNQDMYWRIIRINGDGTVRMIYDGTQAHDNGTSSTNRRAGRIEFNSYYDRNGYVGYMFGWSGATTYALEHSNELNSEIKTYLEGSISSTNTGWYYTNILATGYHNYVADAIYCNDRSLSSGTGITTTSSKYGAYNRLYTNKQPTLKCDLADYTSDSFTVSTDLGSGKLKYPVGLITADEVVMAGGKYPNANSKYYLYTGHKFWTMSPKEFSFSEAMMFIVNTNGELYDDYYESDKSTVGVRPVISLKSNAIKEGTGTKTDPFTIGVQDMEFTYGTSEQTYTVSKSGTYKLEAWGSQGESYNSTYIGGKGGYISGTISLTQGDVLTITTGGVGTNGGGVSSSAADGGGATIIKLNGTTIMTAAGGGGASPTGSGTAGGSGNAAGGTSVGAGAGVAGTNGGGGSASPYYETNCVETDECASWNYYNCYHPYYYEPYRTEYGCTASSSDENNYTCTLYCFFGQIDSSWWQTTLMGETVYAKTFDITCSEYKEECDTTYGNPGNGGTSSIGTGVTLVTKTDGNNSGNGHAKISFVS